MARHAIYERVFCLSLWAEVRQDGVQAVLEASVKLYLTPITDIDNVVLLLQRDDDDLVIKAIH